MPRDSFSDWADGRERFWVGLAYALTVLGVFTGMLSTLAAVVLCHIRGGRHMDGTNAGSHYSYMLRTFWWTLFWAVVSTVLLFVFVGVLGYAIVAIWYLWRTGRGLVLFLRFLPVPGYPPQS